MNNRVVVTGIGGMSPIGRTFALGWEALKEGRCGTRELERFAGLKWRFGGPLEGPSEFATAKDIRRYDRFALHALGAAMMAVRDAAIAVPEHAAVIIGSSRGGISSLEEAARGRASAYLMAGTTVGMAASLVSERLGAKGHVAGVSSACASGAAAIGDAFELISSGRASVALAGGTEAPLCDLCQRGYGVAGALSASGVLNPFGPRRDGFILGEGACVLVLEARDHALGRGARIYGEVAGYGNTSDAHHPTAPSPEGQARAMRAALSRAGLMPQDVGLISAHAPSTPLGDRAEAEAIADVFGGASPAIYAPKGSTGHMLAASGAMEAGFALMCLHEQTVPPVPGEVEFPLNVSRAARREAVDVAMVDSFGFGGMNSVLVLRRADR